MSGSKSNHTVGAIFADLAPVSREEAPRWAPQSECAEPGPSLPPETAATLLHAKSRTRTSVQEEEPPSPEESHRRLPLGVNPAPSCPSEAYLLEWEARTETAQPANDGSGLRQGPTNHHADNSAANLSSLDEVRAAIVALHRAKRDLLEQMTPEVLKLTQLVAERVLCTEALRDPDLSTRLVREGMRVLDRDEHVAVILGPGFAHVASKLQADLELDEIRAEVQVHEDLLPFACRLECELGTVDESLEARLDRALARYLKWEESPRSQHVGRNRLAMK